MAEYAQRNRWHTNHTIPILIIQHLYSLQIEALISYSVQSHATEIHYDLKVWFWSDKTNKWWIQKQQNKMSFSNWIKMLHNRVESMNINDVVFLFFFLNISTMYVNTSIYNRYVTFGITSISEFTSIVNS